MINRRLVVSTLVLLINSAAANAQQRSIDSRLEGFDAYMAQVLKDWNVPGIGVGIVVKDKLIISRSRATGSADPFVAARGVDRREAANAKCSLEPREPY
jgi:hypothetical protein